MQKAINNISTLSTTANGATRLFSNSAVVQQYASALNGLNKEQALLALSYKNLSTQQKEQILAQMGLIASENTIQSELLQTTLAQKGVSAEKSKAILIELGLMNQQTGELLTQKACTQADLEAILAQKGITGAQAEGIISALGLSGANAGLTASFGLLGKAIWGVTKALLSNPITWIVAGFAGLVAITDAVTTSTEEYKEQLDDLKSEYNEITSKIQSVNSELQTTIDRMKELEGKDSLTFTEKEEYDNLVKTNNELQRKIDLLELEEKQKNKEKNKTFVDTMVSDTENPFEHEVNPDGKKPKGQYSISDEYLTSETGYIEAQFEIRDQLLEDLANAETEKEKGRIQKRIDEIEKYLNDKNDEWKNVSDGISYIENPTTEDDKAVNEWLDYIADFQDRMAIAMSKDDASSNAQYKTNTFNRVVDNWQFDETVQGLQDLGKEGKVTAEMLNDPKYDEFINKLVFLGVIDSADNLEDVALAFNSVADSAENAADSASQYGDEIAILNVNDTVNSLNAKLKPAVDSIAEAYNDIFTEDGFTRENIGLDMFASIQKELDELSDAGIEVDYSSFENLVDVLNDTESTTEEIKDAFDEVAYSIADAAISGAEDFETLKSALEELGYADSELVAFEALIQNTDALKEAGFDMTESGIEDFINRLGISSENSAQAVAMLTLQMQLQNNENMDTSGEVANLKALAEKAGYTGKVIEYLTELEKIYQEVATHSFTQAEVQQKLTRARELQGLIRMEASKINLAPSPKTQDWEPVEKEVKKSAGKAGKSAGEAYKDALKDELSDLDKIIGYIGDLFDDQIDALEDAKDSAIDALEEARDKEIEALEKQKSALEDYKDSLEDANKERQLAMSLQKAQYELQRMLSQRTSLIFSEDKGFHYVQDTEGIRDKRNEVENIELDIKLHEIDEQIEDIDSEIEEVEEKYEKLISDTEAYYDAQINSLKLLQEQVEAITKAAENQEILALLEKYGINVSDILVGNEEALAKLKDRYLEVASALSNYEATGAMDDLATSSDKASSSVSKVADATTKIDDEKVSNLSSAMEGLGDTSNLDAITKSLGELNFVIGEISKTLSGIDSEGGLLNALEGIQNISLGTTGKNATGLINQFELLKTAIMDVTSAINGEGNAQSQNQPQNGSPSTQDTTNSSASSGSSSLKQAIKDQVDEARTLLDEEIVKFAGEEESLLAAVTDVTTAIAGDESEKKSDSDVDATNLMGAVEALTKTTLDEKIGIPAQKTAWEELLTIINECVSSLNTMIAKMKDLSEMDFSGGGGSHTSAGGKSHGGGGGSHEVNGNANVDGNAYTSGTWGSDYSGKALTGELGRELVVDPNTGTWRTVGDNGAEFVDIKRGDIVFNHKQTEAILKHGKVAGRGKAFANGTDISTIKTPTNLPPYLRELQEGDRMYDLIQKMNAHNELIQSQIIPPVNSIQKNMDMMTRNISNVNNNNQHSIQVNMTGDIVCKGVTAEEVAVEFNSALQREFMGLSLNAYQKSMKR